MTDPSDNGVPDQAILWADARLDSIQAGYEEFAIRVREETGGTKLLRCLAQCRFSQLAPAWGESYLLSGEASVLDAPDDWQVLAARSGAGQHFLFYLSR